ncbi:MAG TPA: hypothetical protein VFU59_00280, partial [Candidatus Eisenbacteria bacterium]|nr:hypothetical protein [Candidatus Eisenbacteria bacterium]
MSGICGVLARPGGPPLPPSGIDAMCRRLAIGATDATSVCATVSLGPVALGASTFGRHQGGVAHISRDGHVVAVAVVGSFYDQDAPRAAVPEHFLARYLEEGIGFVERIRGEAVFAVWDGRSDTLHLTTDRFRFHSLYVADLPEQFVFASRIGAILASPIPFRATLRPEAIVDAVGTSIIPTPATAYREISKVPPAQRLSHRAGATTFATYWDIDFRNPR